MSLQEFETKIKEIGGIKNTKIENNKLFVTYLGNPHDYTTKRDQLRKDYPKIKQTGRSENSSGHVTLIYKYKS